MPNFHADYCNVL